MYVRVEVENERQFIKIEEIDGLTFHAFVKKVVHTFDVENAGGKKVHIYDHLNTRVNDDDTLKYLLENNSESLVLKVVFIGDNDCQNVAITSEDIKNFLDENGGTDILHEYRTNQSLNEKMRKRLVNIIVDLIIHRFGYYPSASEKTMVAKATVDLFPCYKTCHSKDGIELFYNVKGKTGWILSNLKNRRVVDKQSKNSGNTEKEDENTHDDETEEYTEENAKDDCTFLRSVVVNKSNRAIIEEKLIATAEYRKKICMDSDNNLLKQFPCLFTHSDLILFDFQHQFGTDSNVLVDMWAKWKVNIKTVLSIHEGQHNFTTGFDEEIEQFLMLLKLLSIRKQGRSNVSKRLNFNQTVDKLLVFIKTGKPLSEALILENVHPYIVAVGSSRQKVTGYHIVVDGKFMNVDKKFSFIQTFDLLFKTYFVFDLSYEDNWMPMMQFIEYYCYKISPEAFTPSQQMIRVYADLNRSNHPVTE